MALYLIKDLDDDYHSKLGVWQITESEKELRSLCSVPSDELEEISYIKSESLRKQKLAVRALLDALFEEKVYLSHHDNGKPYIETGSVTAVSAPRPKYPIPGSIGQIPQMETVVDVTVLTNGQSVTLQGLPAQADIADSPSGGNVVVSASREAMNAEVSSMKSKSENILASIDTHRAIIGSCDEMLAFLNPEYAQVQQLMEINRTLISQLGSQSPAAEPKGRTKQN